MLFRSKGFHDDLWIASLENKLRTSTDNIVISDCRFPNEIKSIKDAGGMVIRVKRGPEPEWYDSAISMNRGQVGNMNWALSKDRIAKLGIHASETAWVGTDFDAVLDNDTSIEDLFTKVRGLVPDHPDAIDSLLSA